MKFNINDYKGKYVMHCKTKEEARDFISKHLPSLWHEGGCCWSSYKSDTVYFFNRKTYQNIPYAEKEGYTILEWSDFMNKGFTKADLRTGDVVMQRDGTIQIAICELNSFITKDWWNSWNNFNSDLTHKDDAIYDIIAIRRPIQGCDCTFHAFDYELGQLVYERPEPEEMTLEEVCRLLGKEIKIVKG
jgi:hypothetical protein